MVVLDSKRANISWKIVAVCRNVVLRFHKRAVNATEIADLRNRRKKLDWSCDTRDVSISR